MNRRAFLKAAALALGASLTPALALNVQAAAQELDGSTELDDAGLENRSADGIMITEGVEKPKPYSEGDGEAEPRVYQKEWPALQMELLPKPVRDVLTRVPRMEISAEGVLFLKDGAGNSRGKVPLARTQWNKEKSTPLDRLLNEWSWGIVLHWYGEPEAFDKTVTGYLRGFDGLRMANNYETRTSAHFLVGDGQPVIQAEAKENVVGIVQTQAPDGDGTPFVASHLRPLNYKLFRSRQQYFVKALEALEYADGGCHSILRDFFDNSNVDPGWRTIAIEITGYNFDDLESIPGMQKTANLLGVIWAIMKRYQIAALDILGHNEIELDKPDPGKLFMATIRFLIGVKALLETDEEMKELVFGRFLNEALRDARPGSNGEMGAVGRYFKFVRDYLVLLSRPAQVYRWEKRSQYWMLLDRIPGIELPGNRRRMNETIAFNAPLDGKISLKGDGFLKPESHMGVDLYPEREQNSRKQSGISEVRLASDGVCLYAGRSQGQCAGKMAIFRHRERDGAEILTLYSHLSELSNLSVGEVCRSGQVIGKIAAPQVFMERFLHFAVAYGATWETDLVQHPDLPLNASPEWIRERFVDPLAYLGSGIG